MLKNKLYFKKSARSIWKKKTLKYPEDTKKDLN